MSGEVEVRPLMAMRGPPQRSSSGGSNDFMRSRTCQVIALVLFALLAFYLLGSLEPSQSNGGGGVPTYAPEKGTEGGENLVDNGGATEEPEQTQEKEIEKEVEGENEGQKSVEENVEKSAEHESNAGAGEADAGCTVMFLYIGKLPAYIGHTIAQAQCWNPTCELYFAGNKTEVDAFTSNSTLNRNTEVVPVYLEDLDITEEYWEFYRKKNKHFSGFWLVTSTRVWLIEHVMRKYNLKDVLYIESDNSVYFDFKEMLPTFRETIPGFSVTPSFEQQSTMSVSFIKDADSLLLMNKFALTRPGGEDDGEMRHLVRFYQNETSGGPGKIDNVPVCPYGPVESTRHMDAFDMVFDNNAWGIWIGGPHLKWQSAERLLSSHMCYPAMKARCCQLEFQQDDKGRWFPMVHYHNPKNESQSGALRLGNIHWHSKKIEFMASSCGEEGDEAYKEAPEWTLGAKYWDGWKKDN